MNNESYVDCSVENKVGWIRLNRITALNAINKEMASRIERQLEDWKQNELVLLVCIEGGEKAFSAGGDLRFLYDQRNGSTEAAKSFFITEYRMDMMIHQYPKPILVYMNGIVMGGGVGLSIGAKHRIVTETTKWAMPETNIGFIPDVGASYFMNEMPGYVGRYLALTSETIGPEDVLYIGAADWYVESSRWPDLRRALIEKVWLIGSTNRQLTELLYKLTSTAFLSDPQLYVVRNKINEHFAFDSVEEIFSSLHRSAQKGDEWTARVYAVLQAKSPTSLKMTLRLLKEGKNKLLSDCFKMELAVGLNLIKSHDFHEGVRAALIDKDRNPKWNPATLEEVDEEHVANVFE